MKKQKITYWVFTGLLAALMTVSAIPNIMSSPESVAYFKFLGYPAYLLPFLGVAKALGVIAIVTPGFTRLKEWAYAGFFFDLAGAMYSHIAIGVPVSQWAPIGIGFIILGGSYIYHHKLLRTHDASSSSLRVAREQPTLRMEAE
jgi:uncharacterized membrane protein YphA (DoxX/SURF4 family)